MRLLFFIACFTLTTGILISCSATHARKSAQVLEGQRKTKLPDSLNRKWKLGIDLTASGTLPVNWQLDADFDKEIVFYSGDGKSLRLLPVLNQKKVKDETVYEVSTGDSTIIIIISEKGCTNNDKPTPSKMVSIKLGENLYTGCGQYLYNNQLNDVWELESINNVLQNKSNFKKNLPFLDFQLETGMLEGFDGCIHFKGTVTIKGSRILFSGLGNFSGSCSNSEVSRIFSSMLNNKLVDYRLSQNKLLLYLGDDSRLEFSRKEF